ncbi:hypothetical protein KUTeg_014436 [Tegillarca granosa]|uniref:Uncharacterized protein n=1 Tax=Tegillarca granosa TaxID=220873 RepID=A0ABQ9EWM6_TEGGR|nr:hypothetical protein KUTeg_014436 [Tegillarca granosa]
MGCSGSSQSGNTRPVNVQGQVMPAMPQAPPYLGPPNTYQIVNLDVPYRMQTSNVWTNSDLQISTLNTEVYEPALVQLYDMDFRLTCFVVTPGSMSASGFITSVDVKKQLRAQGIFRKKRDDDKNEKYKLQIVKSVLPQQIFTYGLFQIGHQSQAQQDHIFKAIHDYTSSGGRLVCLEVTGGNFQAGQPQQQRQQQAFGMGGMGMNNQPALMFYGYGPNTQKYVYQMVPAALVATHNPMTTAFNGQWSLQMDWQNITANYLSQGWRLVDIFLNQNNEHFTNRTFMATKYTINLGAMFIFEKPSSKMNDNTPVYECTMVEYHAKGKMNIGFGSLSTNVPIAWEPVIESMGQNGWELVRCLQTPATPIQHGFMNMSPDFSNVMWLFFQRKIMKPEEAPAAKTDDEPPAPVEAPKSSE